MTGILLINLGTPDEPTSKAVRRYLREFLMDGQVIDINFIGRWFLVNGIIAPFRAPKSAKAYQKIWGDKSPLLFHTEQLTQMVGNALDDNYAVTMGMRYGNPSIKTALELLVAEKPDKIIVLPLYPQYALSSTQTCIDLVEKLKKKIKDCPPLEFAPPFFEHPGFIRAFAEVAKPYILGANPDHVLMSFHGLPEHHLTKLNTTEKYCFTQKNCCDQIGELNSKCYRAQSFRTAHLIARDLNLTSDNYSISFQSRLGRRPWIKPYTDEVIIDLAKKGCKRLVVICPSFVADCLETLEEIGIRARESFLEHGGESLELVPSLNSHPRWVEAVCQMVS